ncbi:MAG: transglutaminase family protein [Pasteurellaceae bacterium]|nr:transglutaminase family protein [Pasteurellaceae bacterium]
MKKTSYLQKCLYLSCEQLYLLTCDEHSHGLPSIRTSFGALTRKARKIIQPDGEIKSNIHQLLQLVYGDWDFESDPELAMHPNGFALDFMLHNKMGSPYTLAALVLYLADKLALPLYPVLFVDELILRAQVGAEVAFIDPWNGQYLSDKDLQVRLEGMLGFGFELNQDYLAICSADKLCDHFYARARQALMFNGLILEAYKLVEYQLALQPADFNLLRDRAFVLLQMGVLHSAEKDFLRLLEMSGESTDQKNTEILAGLAALRFELAGQTHHYQLH